MRLPLPSPPAGATVRIEVADFAGRIGQRFELAVPGLAANLPLTLTEVVDLGSRIGVGLRESPFSLRFGAPRRPALQQRTYALHHPELGDLELFLVPIAEDLEGRTYEAVFT